MPEASANIGVVGLAVMGSNLARNLASREGNTVAIFNRSHAKTQTLLDEHPEAGFVAASGVGDASLSVGVCSTSVVMVALSLFSAVSFRRPSRQHAQAHRGGTPARASSPARRRRPARDVSGL